MLTGAEVGILFMVLALVFFGLSFRDYRKSAGARTPTRQTWMRIALIFGIVGVLIYLANTLRKP